MVFSVNGKDIFFGITSFRCHCEAEGRGNPYDRT
jgi:hypothetical protein